MLPEKLLYTQAKSGSLIIKLIISVHGYKKIIRQIIMNVIKSIDDSSNDHH